MLKPEGYDEVQVGYEVPNLGGHYAVIKHVSEKKSAANNDMLVILFDFAENDKQKGYFMDKYNKDTRPDKKYPNDATHYMTIDKSTSYGTRNLKGFITAVENSNTGFKVQWGDNFCKQFAGKKIGCVFGPVLDFYNGEEHKKNGFRRFCSWDKVETVEIPDVYETQAHKDGMKNHPIADSEGFMQISADLPDELPFA